MAGNIVFGGIIGLAVDAVTGGMYKLSPEQLTATMGSEGMAMLGDARDVILVSLVESADSTWEKVGQLEQE